MRFFSQNLEKARFNIAILNTTLSYKLKRTGILKW